MRLLLARLVEAEIVSPYCGILINAGMGNPTAPFARPLGIGEFKASGEALDIHGLYKGIRIPFLYPHLGSSPALPSLSSSARALAFPLFEKALQISPDPELEASGWPPSLRRRISRNSGRPGT